MLRLIVWEFILVTNTNNNTLENHEQITLNNKMAASASQIPVLWQCISITIPLGKQVHPCTLYACLPLPYKAANDGILMEIHCHISGICEAEAAILFFSVLCS